MSSREVGDFCGPSIYDMLIQTKGYPFLRPDPPKWASGRLRASDMMTREVVTLRPIESIKLREVLYATEHNMFPLLYSARVWRTLWHH
jgi:chloride channel 7